MNTIKVKSNHKTRSGDPNHVAFYENHPAHGNTQEAVVRGGGVFEIAETDAVKQAITDGLIKEATPTEVKAAKEAEAEAEAPGT